MFFQHSFPREHRRRDFAFSWASDLSQASVCATFSNVMIIKRQRKKRERKNHVKINKEQSEGVYTMTIFVTISRENLRITWKHEKKRQLRRSSIKTNLVWPSLSFDGLEDFDVWEGFRFFKLYFINSLGIIFIVSKHFRSLKSILFRWRFPC